MRNSCFIIKDLLPLYNEDLLSEETTAWVKAHLETCPECKKLQQISSKEVQTEPIENSMDQELMFKRINRKLSLYQIIFVTLSFFIAINTSLLNESFGFILWYPVLGAVTYLFYKDIKLVFLLSFIPIFLWSFGSSLISFVKYADYERISTLGFLWQNLLGSFATSVLHLIFALIGGIIGVLILKLKNHNELND